MLCYIIVSMHCGLGRRDGILQLCEHAIKSCTSATGDGKHQPRWFGLWKGHGCSRIECCGERGRCSLTDVGLTICKVPDALPRLVNVWGSRCKLHLDAMLEAGSLQSACCGRLFRNTTRLSSHLHYGANQKAIGWTLQSSVELITCHSKQIV